MSSHLNIKSQMKFLFTKNNVQRKRAIVHCESELGGGGGYLQYYFQPVINLKYLNEFIYYDHLN